MMRPITVLVILPLALQYSIPVCGNDEAVALITRGGGEIDLGNRIPGLIEVSGDTAFSIMEDNAGGIIVAGSEALPLHGRSRFVVFGHEDFLKNPQILKHGPALELVVNSIRWCGRSTTPRISVHGGLTGLAIALKRIGLDAKIEAPVLLDPDDLPDVYCVAGEMDDTRLRELTKAGRGMGIVVAATYPVGSFTGNRLITTVGLKLIPDQFADNPHSIPITIPQSQTIHHAFTELSLNPHGVAPARRDELISTIKEGRLLRGRAQERFLIELEQLSSKVGPIIPTVEKPLVPGADPLIDMIVSLEDELNQSLPAGKMYPLPAAANYPGEVPNTAERIEKTVAIECTWRGSLSGRENGHWNVKEMRPVGLYAPPGEVITVNSPTAIAGEGFEVVLGAYDGDLEEREEWERYPRLQRSIDIEGSVTKISNALGGLVTIRVPKGSRHGSLDFTITGAVESPLYIAGRTDLLEWREQIRNAPAPWAELASDHVILAIPSTFIRKLDDPGQVMKVWDEIIEKSAELCGGVNRNLYRAERVVFERQPSVGYMHSGYPIAAPQDVSAVQAVDAQALKSNGNESFFHELGHNHQHDLWYLPGTTEATCDLWTVYLFEEYIGSNRAESIESLSPLNRMLRQKAYFRNGRKFESDWNTLVALESFLQVQETFGWEPYKMVFAEYNALPESEWPKTQQEKNDQWVIRLSKACGRNLAPFWTKWNLPLSDSVFAKLRILPVWEDHPVAGLSN